MFLSPPWLNFRLLCSESRSENKSIAVQYQLQLYVIRIRLWNYTQRIKSAASREMRLIELSPIEQKNMDGNK